MLLDVEGTGVQESPELSPGSVGEDHVPELTENVGDNEDEQAADGQAGGPAIRKRRQ